MKFRQDYQTICRTILGQNYTPIKPLHIRKWLSVQNLVGLSRLIICQWLFTCSNSSLETLKQGAKFVQS